MTNAVERYLTANIRKFVVGVNRKLEPELIEYLESKDNIQKYILDLIRADMRKEQEK